MVKATRIYRNLIFLMLFFAAAFSAKAQKEHIAKLTVSEKEVIAGQPFNVKISVYTPTWFTKAPDIADYNIKDGFSKRTGRPLSIYETINGKRFTTLNYNFVVFPMATGKLNLPALEVNFESPPEGDYKGKKINVWTNAASIEVLPVPDIPEETPPFVAKDVQISQSWNKPLSDLKIGDVIEQTITIRAEQTLANIIPPTRMDTLEWASVYPKRPQLEQSVEENPTTASRTEIYSWLLEKPGVFKTPKINISWYDANSNKWNMQNLKSVELTIADDQDMAMLKTLQDSLMINSREMKSDSGGGEITFLGLSVQKLSIILTLTVALILIVLYVFKKLRAWRLQQKQAYRTSEKFYFDELVKSSNTDIPAAFNDRIYAWIDHLDVKFAIHNISDLALISGNNNLGKAISAFQKSIYGDEKSTKKDGLIDQLVTEIKKSRKQIFMNNPGTAKEQQYTFNP